MDPTHVQLCTGGGQKLPRFHTVFSIPQSFCYLRESRPGGLVSCRIESRASIAGSCDSFVSLVETVSGVCRARPAHVGVVWHSIIAAVFQMSSVWHVTWWYVTWRQHNDQVNNGEFRVHSFRYLGCTTAGVVLSSHLFLCNHLCLVAKL